MHVEERQPASGPDGLIWVSMLSAMAYCERLFYLEHVEGIQVANAPVLEGRAAHVPLEGEIEGGVRLEDSGLGLSGRVDLLRFRDGKRLPWEVKKGRGKRTRAGLEPWPNERIQLGAYAMLLEATTGEVIHEGRIHYLEDAATAKLVIDEGVRQEVREALERARSLLASQDRPPPTTDENKCWQCSLAPVCLPEENRLAADEGRETLRLYPAGYDSLTLHVHSPGARVGKAGEQLTVSLRDKAAEKYPIVTIGELVVHGGVQVSTQALHFCIERGISVHWLSGGGRYITGAMPPRSIAGRRRRQYQAFSDERRCLDLAQRLVAAKLYMQLGYLMRCRRERKEDRAARLAAPITNLRSAIRLAGRAGDLAELLGYEGSGAKAYFEGLAQAINPGVPETFRPEGRSRRPPRDPFNCLLSFGYSLLYKDTVAAINVVGLDPGWGFYHQIRGTGMTLALDLMELFRVPLVDMAVLGSINRGSWVERDFEITPAGVYLGETGRRKAIGLFEERKQDTWRHPVLGYSLTYARLIEVEVRLLEKALHGESDLFARVRLR